MKQHVLKFDGASETVGDSYELRCALHADSVRWCEPYSRDIIENYRRDERKTLTGSTCLLEESRRIVVNWLCNVSRKQQLRSETFWLAVNTFDRYVASLNTDTNSEVDCHINFQCVAAACIHLAIAFQESADMPYLEETQQLCGNRYSVSRLRNTCWQIVSALDCDLYWPSPVCFYRFYSRALDQTQIEHTMTKFVVDSTAFSRTDLLCRYFPSTLAACALLVARWCHSKTLPTRNWMFKWNKCCDLLAHVDHERKMCAINCCVDICRWVQSLLRQRDINTDNANGKVLAPAELVVNDATFTDSVLRRFAYRELFAVSSTAYLPDDAATVLKKWMTEQFFPQI